MLIVFFPSLSMRRSISCSTCGRGFLLHALATHEPACRRRKLAESTELLAVAPLPEHRAASSRIAGAWRSRSDRDATPESFGAELGELSDAAASPRRDGGAGLGAVDYGDDARVTKGSPARRPSPCYEHVGAGGCGSDGGAGGGGSSACFGGGGWEGSGDYDDGYGYGGAGGDDSSGGDSGQSPAVAAGSFDNHSSDGGAGADSGSDDDSSGGPSGSMASDGPARLDRLLQDPAVLTNTLLSSAQARGHLSQVQLQYLIDAVRTPGFNPSLVLGSASAVKIRVDTARGVFGSGAPPYQRVDIDCSGLVLPVGVTKPPFVIVYDIEAKLRAILCDPELVRADRLHLDVSGPEPSELPGRAPVIAGSACFSDLGRDMYKASRARHASTSLPCHPLLYAVELDASRASAFGDVMVFPVILVLMSLKRPFRHRKGAMPTIALLPIVGAKAGDCDAARVGADAVLQRALALGVVGPLARLWRSGMKVVGVAGFPSPILVVPSPHVVVNDHAGGTKAAAVNADACIECPAKRSAADYLTRALPRRTITEAAVARAKAASAPTKVAAAAALADLSLHEVPSAFIEWTLPGGPWAGCPFGLSLRSSLCFLHHFLLGYCKWYDKGIRKVFSTCANFTSPAAWRRAQADLARFIESQPCFDTGVEQARIVSLRDWARKSFWSGEALFAAVTMTTAALLAAPWPFQDPTLQKRLVAVSLRTLHMGRLAGAGQWPVGHGPALQASTLSTHVAFRDVEAVFCFSIDSKIKAHNFCRHLVKSARAIGVASEFNLALGIEAVHPANKVDFRLSARRGEVQEVLAKAGSRREFAATELAHAFDRRTAAVAPSDVVGRSSDRRGDGGSSGSVSGGAAAPLPQASAHADSDDDEAGSDEGVAALTCAFATGSLVPGMLISDFSIRLPRLVELLVALFPGYWESFHGDCVAPSGSAAVFEEVRCYLRRAVKLSRGGVCNRLLPVTPECLSDDPHAVLRPCVQLFRDTAGGSGVEADPAGFCEVLLALSYDVRPGRRGRMSERTLRRSDADEMVLVRRLVPFPKTRSAEFVRCAVPGPPLAEARRADARHFELLPLSALARPRAVFPAGRGAGALPEGELSPWSGAEVNVLLLL